jgi:uncharacterized lipoprotein YddW (UPF0748 family)
MNKFYSMEDKMLKKHLLVLLVLFISFNQISSQMKEEMRAVKLTNVDSNVLNSDKNIAEAMDFLASININAILPVVLNGGWTLYPSAVMDSLFGREIHPTFTGRDPLKRLIIEAHRRGIEVYPWFEYGFAAWYSGTSGPANGGHILQTFPEWACRDQEGNIAKENGFDWMSAIDPDVQEFMNSLVREVIENYDVDGVEFSDRIPAMPIKGGYEVASVNLYKQEHNGQNPPTNISDESWKRWRADKLNDWYRGITQIVKSYDENIFVSASPSLYPWGYDNYLQDAKTWMDEGIADHYIPQLYRYNINDYKYELNRAVQQVGSNIDKLFAGILMNLGTGSNAYLISEDYLFQAIDANRSKGVTGEVYFYYEGFRKENNKFADTLRATYYSEPALVPLRDGIDWRPEGIVVNEDDPGNIIIGDWEEYPMKGFEGKILRTNKTSQNMSISYFFDIPAKAFYDVYYYFTPNTSWTDSADVMIFSVDIAQGSVIAQNNLQKKGWHKIGTCYTEEGISPILTISNKYLKEGEYLVADAAMLMINRKLSPDVIVGVENELIKSEIPSDYSLAQNYPNPFNPTTNIQYNIPVVAPSPAVRDKLREGQNVTLKVYDILGSEVTTLVNEIHTAGKYTVEWNATNVPSGIYFYRLSSDRFTQTKKMVLLK